MKRYLFRGSSYEIGWKHGQAIRDVFPAQIQMYLDEGMFKYGTRDKNKVIASANSFINSLPEHFQEELYAFAEGAGVPLEQVALWHCEYLGMCSTLVSFPNSIAWTGHNVDYATFNSYQWSCTMVMERKGRIPILNLALCGDLHSYQGVNKSQLWIHSNWLPADDQPAANKRTIPWLFFLREALETCETIAEVESLLSSCNRDTGVALTVIDGKTNNAVIFECSHSNYNVLYPNNNMLLITNRVSETMKDTSDQINSTSWKRYKRMQELTASKYPVNIDDFINILSDAEVEQRGIYEGTFQSVIAAPALKEIWLACDAYPAASQGTYQKVPWPWGA